MYIIDKKAYWCYNKTDKSKGETTMKFYVKQAFVPFVYIIFTSIIALAISSIDQSLTWLKVVLGICNLALYSTVVFGISYKEGQEALKIRIANDLERKHMVTTGEDRPLRIHEEYKWWKGLLSGVIACVPILVLMIVHTILVLINPVLIGSGVVASFINMTFFMFMMLGIKETKDLTPLEPAKFYFNLIAIPIVAIVCGIGYNMGARKIQRQQDVIKAKHRELYGEEI